jgi:AcrR family transcriptional regulator
MKLQGTLKRITKHPHERREDLINAAISVFAAKGLHEATVADVTKAAGVAKGTFYLYFTSKEHLLAALKERFVHEALEHAASLFERVGQEDWWGLVDATIESAIDFALERRDSIRIFVREGLAPETRDMMAESERKLNALYAAGIQAGVDAGAFQVEDPELTAVLLHHAIEGSVAQAILFDQKVDRDRLIATAKALAHKALAPTA